MVKSLSAMDQAIENSWFIQFKLHKLKQIYKKKKLQVLQNLNNKKDAL